MYSGAFGLRTPGMKLRSKKCGLGTLGGNKTLRTSVQKPSLKPSRPETVELKPPYIQLKVNA